MIKSVPKGNIINVWENMENYKQFHNDQFIKEQRQAKTKQDDLFQITNSRFKSKFNFIVDN